MSDGESNSPTCSPANGDDQPEHTEDVCIPGQLVKLTQVPSRPDLAGLCGTVLPSEINSEHVTVRVHLAAFKTEVVHVSPDDLQLAGEEPRVSVMWTYIRRLNTGNHGRLATVVADAYAADDDDDSSLREISCTISELHDFVARMQFEVMPTTLCEAFGLRLLCYAHPFTQEDVGKGRDNVLASHFTCGVDDGRTANPIVGTSFLLRLSPTTGEVVDFSHLEAIRSLFYINDVLSLYDASSDRVLSARVWQSLKTCYPYYEAGCRMSEDGFFGIKSMKRLEDGTFEKSPPDMTPASSYIT